MTTPKSPEQIMEEFVRSKTKIEHVMRATEEIAWLRSSMSSLLLYMAERMEKETMLRTPNSAVERMFSPEECDVWNAALDDCRTLLIEEARKISEV